MPTWRLYSILYYHYVYFASRTIQILIVYQDFWVKLFYCRFNYKLYFPMTAFRNNAHVLRLNFKIIVFQLQELCSNRCVFNLEYICVHGIHFLLHILCMTFATNFSADTVTHQNKVDLANSQIALICSSIMKICWNETVIARKFDTNL